MILPSSVSSTIIACLALLGPAQVTAKTHKDTPCLWGSGSHTYDLRPLIVPPTKASYSILDGDIPCTPEVEPSFNYMWNFCANAAPVPGACDKMGKTGVALQYLDLGGKDYDCYVIGKYDPAKDDLHYTLLQQDDPSKGVSMHYPYGEKCTYSGIMRSAVIDVQCADVEAKVVSAQATSQCSYHLVMQSVHGCPAGCKVTSNGLCNGHGHCAYDSNAKESYCYCDYGYGGDKCEKMDQEEAYDGHSVQVGLMSTLIVVALGMVAVLGYMTHRVLQYRKAQSVGTYNFLSALEMSHHGRDDSF